MEKNSNIEELYSKLLTKGGKEETLLKAAIHGHVLTPQNFDIALTLADDDFDRAAITENRGDLKGALKIWKTIKDEYPENSYCEMARIYEELGKHKKARSAKENLLSCLIESDGYNEAIKIAEELGKDEKIAELKVAIFDRLMLQMTKSYEPGTVPFELSMTFRGIDEEIEEKCDKLKELGQELNYTDIDERIYKAKIQKLTQLVKSGKRVPDSTFFRTVITLAKEHEDWELTEQYRQEGLDYLCNKSDLFRSSEQKLALEVCKTQEEYYRYLHALEERGTPLEFAEAALKFGQPEKAKEVYKERMLESEQCGNFAYACEMAEKAGETEMAEVYMTLSKLL